MMKQEFENRSYQAPPTQQKRIKFSNRLHYSVSLKTKGQNRKNSNPALI